MSDVKSHLEAVLSPTDLAFERTILAENRTLMAWIRTAISLISFGFTIYKFFQETLGATYQVLSPRKVGMIMMFLGMLSLVWGLMEHQDTMKRLKKSYPALRNSRTRLLAVLILIFGLLLLSFAFFRL